MYVVVIFVVLLLIVYHVWEVVSRDKVIIQNNTTQYFDLSVHITLFFCLFQHGVAVRM